MFLCCLITRFTKVTIIHYCILACLISPIKASEDRPSLNPQDFYFEFLTFRSNEAEKTYLEVFCQIPKEQLSYANTAKGFQGDYTLSLRVYNQFGHDVDWATHRDSVIVLSLSQVENVPPQVIHFPLLLEPGEYTIRIQFTDKNSLAKARFQKDIYIPDYRDRELHLSSLQLASDISPAPGPSRLVKNNITVVPIVHHVFRQQLQKLFLYFEIYNLRFASSESERRFRVDYTILDLFGTEIKSLSLIREKLGQSTFVGLAIPFTGLSAGTYQLRVKISDLDSLNEVEKGVYFSLAKPETHFVDYNQDRKISLPLNSVNLQ